MTMQPCAPIRGAQSLETAEPAAISGDIDAAKVELLEVADT